MKDLFIRAHEELVDEYLDAHPNATWAQAYDRTAAGADARMRDRLADRIDHAKQLRKGN